MAPAAGMALGLVAPAAAFSSSVQASACVVLALLLAAVAERAGHRRLAGVGGFAAGVALGARAALALDRPDRPEDVARHAGPGASVVEMEGRIDSDPWAVPGRVSFDLEAASLRAGGVAGATSGRVRVAVDGLPGDGVPVPAWRRGDLVRVSGTMRRPRDLATPGAPSQVAALARQGIRARLRVKSPLLVERLREGDSLRGRVREAIVSALDRHVAGGRRPSGEPEAGTSGATVVPESRAAAVLEAMLVDDRALLDEDALRQLADAGVLHVLSISGLHVAIVAGAAWLLAGIVGATDRPRAAGALLAAWGYVAVAGFPAPAVRSAIVSSVVLAGRALHREATALNSLALAFLVAGAVEPGGLRGPGFQATFAAAAGLILWAPRLAGWLESRRVPRLLAQSVAASLAAELFVLPVVLAWFGRASLVGPAVNLVAIPLSAVALFAGFAVAALGPVAPAAADLAGALARLAIDWLFGLVAGGWLPGPLRVARPEPLAATAAFLLVALGALGAASAARRLAALALALALLFVPLGRHAPRDGLRLTALDVGQGDALLVEGPQGETLLVDGGGVPGGRPDLGERVVVPFLLSQGIRKLDVVALTHAHPDHGGGLRAVLEALAVRELWVGDDPPGDPLLARLAELARRRGTRVVARRRGDSLRVGTVEVEVLGPPAGLPPPGEVDNDRSLVLRLVHGGRALLLTGDVHAAGESGALGSGSRLASDVLKVAHHGSSTSSTAGFLDAVRPRVAIISCGADNRFGHPDEAVLERLAARSVHVLRSDLDGTVAVELPAGGGTRIATFRARFRSSGQ